MNPTPLAHTFDQLGPVLQLHAECRQALASRGAGWDGAAEALSLLDDLEEHAAHLISRCGLLPGSAGRPPERGSPDWRRAVPVH